MAFGAILFSSCSSQESIEERRRRHLGEDATKAAPAESTDSASELASGQRDADLAALDDGSTRVRTAALPGGANGGGQDARDEDDLDDLGDLDDDDDTPPVRSARSDDAAPRRPAPRARGGDNVADVLDDLRQDADGKKAEAQYYAEKGDAAMASGRYQEAEDHYKVARAADPGNADLIKKLHDAQFQLGKRSGDVGALGSRVIGEVGVEREQRIAEIERNLDLARKSLAAKKIEQAEEQAALAVEKISLDLELAGEERAKEARSLLDQIRRQRTQLEADRKLERLRSSQGKADAELAQEKQRRHDRVQDLLRKALDAIYRGEYTKVKDLCDTILSIEPTNKVAAFWKRSADERLLKERRLKIIEDRLANQKILDRHFVEAATPYEEVFVFPEDDYWARVRQRRDKFRPASLEEPAPVQAIKTALDSTRIDVEFDESPLKDVVDHFRQVVGINIVVDPGVDSESITVTQSINQLPASSALRLVLGAHELGYAFRDNILVVTSADEARPDTEFEAYNVSDLLMKVRDFHAPELRLRGTEDEAGAGAPIDFGDDFAEEEDSLDPDRLIELIQESTGGEDQWDGENNSIEQQRGQLFVNATRELHQKVRDVLANLRQDSDLYVVVEARFIDITDDFLEDIGIDSRELSDRNWDRVVPFGGDLNDSSSGGNDLGLVEQGSVDNNFLVGGLDRWAGRVQHIIDGFTGTITGERLTAGGGIGGGSFQATWLEPFQVNVILRAVQEKQDVRQLTAPVVTAHNNERVYVSVITQRAYIADYELVSGGTGFAIIEVADPVVQTFQEGVILDVDPTISHDKKYVTLDVKPTLATLIGGIISTINISLGSFTNVAFQVPIGIPQISLQQSFTSVTVPNGGTVLLGGFKGLREGKFSSYLPIIGKIPILKNLARRKATIREKRSLVILLTARIVNLRDEEARKYNPQ